MDFEITEHLQLTLEEVFFLAFALGCLNVESEDGVCPDTV